MHLPEGTFLQNGKYKIVRFIKSGGFGCTYEGIQTMLGVRIAIKEFFVNDFCNREPNNKISLGTKSKAADFQKLKQGFVKEASVLYQMQNPHIVRVTDIFEENGTAYYVMDYIDGSSLADILKKKGKFSEEEAVGYILQVCDALKYVHSQNRMHMDIKPGNIMLNKNGKVILIDFGTSKYYDEQTGEQTSTLMGIYTQGYAPIEQISRSVKTFNPATDIYSLGATLYKLLTGIIPPDSLALVSGNEELKQLPSSISASTRKAIEAAMQLFSEQRSQTIDEFVRILSERNTKEEIIKTVNVPKIESASTTSEDKEIKQLKNEEKPEEPIVKVEEISSENYPPNKTKFSVDRIDEEESTKSSKTKIYIGIVAAIVIFLLGGQKSSRSDWMVPRSFISL